MSEMPSRPTGLQQLQGSDDDQIQGQEPIDLAGAGTDVVEQQQAFEQRLEQRIDRMEKPLEQLEQGIASLASLLQKEQPPPPPSAPPPAPAAPPLPGQSPPSSFCSCSSAVQPPPGIPPKCDWHGAGVHLGTGLKAEVNDRYRVDNTIGAWTSHLSATLGAQLGRQQIGNEVWRWWNNSARRDKLKIWSSQTKANRSFFMYCEDCKSAVEGHYGSWEPDNGAQALATLCQFCKITPDAPNNPCPVFMFDGFSAQLAAAQAQEWDLMRTELMRTLSRC